MVSTPSVNRPVQINSEVSIQDSPPPSRNQLKQLINKFSADSLTNIVFQALGDLNHFNVPKLAWQDRFHEGKTGYIDGIRPSDMSHSVMWGIDQWNRPYIAAKVVGGNKPQTGVETFFQRYTDDGECWTSGKHYLPNHLSIISSRMGIKEFAQFQKLVKGEEIILEDWYSKHKTIVKLA